MGLINKLFGKYLLITNVGSCGLMMAFGDSIQQRIEYFQKQNSRPNYLKVAYRIDKSDNNAKLQPLGSAYDSYKHDYFRTLNMSVAGLAQGPFLHYFYQFLEKLFPGKRITILAQKMVLDQGFFSPSLILIFFIAVGIMERQTIQGIWQEMKLKFLDTFKMDLCFWPPIQIVNFLLIPTKYRVVYLNIMVIIYNALLSHIKHDNAYNQLEGLQLELQQA